MVSSRFSRFFSFAKTARSVEFFPFISIRERRSLFCVEVLIEKRERERENPVRRNAGARRLKKKKKRNGNARNNSVA